MYFSSILPGKSLGADSANVVSPDVLHFILDLQSIYASFLNDL